MSSPHGHQLIVAIVEKGCGDKVASAAVGAGAGGVTLSSARGHGLRERLGLIGQTILPEKEVLMVIVTDETAQAIFDSVVQAGGLETPGAGIAFRIPVLDAVGLVPHFSGEVTETDS